MKDIRQIKVISQAFDNEKEKFLSELVKVNDVINKKLAVIKKMHFYLEEYNNADRLKISRSVPVLNQNLDAFTAKIKGVIRSEENEIKKMQQIRETLLASIGEVDKKIQLMNIFENRHNVEVSRKDDKNAQRAMDDVMLNKVTRNENE